MLKKNYEKSFSYCKNFAKRILKVETQRKLMLDVWVRESAKKLWLPSPALMLSHRAWLNYPQRYHRFLY